MAENEGLQEKFEVTRLIPSSRGIDHSECFYFVLDPEHDPDAAAALAFYAHAVRARGNTVLADDIGRKLLELSLKHHQPAVNEAERRLDNDN